MKVIVLEDTSAVSWILTNNNLGLLYKAVLFLGLLKASHSE